MGLVDRSALGLRLSKLGSRSLSSLETGSIDKWAAVSSARGVARSGIILAIVAPGRALGYPVGCVTTGKTCIIVVIRHAPVVLLGPLGISGNVHGVDNDLRLLGLWGCIGCSSAILGPEGSLLIVSRGLLRAAIGPRGMGNSCNFLLLLYRGFDLGQYFREGGLNGCQVLVLGRACIVNSHDERDGIFQGSGVMNHNLLPDRVI